MASCLYPIFLYHWLYCRYDPEYPDNPPVSNQQSSSNPFMDSSPTTFNYTPEQLGGGQYQSPPVELIPFCLKSKLKATEWDIDIIKRATICRQAFQHPSDGGARSDPPAFNHTVGQDGTSMSDMLSLMLNVTNSRYALPFLHVPAAPTQSSNMSSLTLNVAHSRHTSSFPPASTQLPDLFYGSSMSHQTLWMDQHSSDADVYGMMGGDNFPADLLEDQNLGMVGADGKSICGVDHLSLLMCKAAKFQIYPWDHNISSPYKTCPVYHLSPHFIFLRVQWIHWCHFLVTPKTLWVHVLPRIYLAVSHHLHSILYYLHLRTMRHPSRPPTPLQHGTSRANCVISMNTTMTHALPAVTSVISINTTTTRAFPAAMRDSSPQLDLVYYPFAAVSNRQFPEENEPMMHHDGPTVTGCRSTELSAILDTRFAEVEHHFLSLSTSTTLPVNQLINSFLKSCRRTVISINYWNLYANYFKDNIQQKLACIGREAPEGGGTSSKYDIESSILYLSSL